jgi:hypothetical protein
MIQASSDAAPAVAERSEGSRPAGTADPGASLDCSKESSATELECSCIEPRLRLMNAGTFEVVPVARKARNRCALHSWLACLEDAEMLLLDNCEGEAPEVTSCFTSNLAKQSLSAFYRAREDVVRALRRNGFPDARYVMRLHYTPGYGPRSGGRRRPHWHGMWKGIPRDRAEEARDVAVPVWCDSLNRQASRKAGREVVVARPQGQYFAAIDNASAMLLYVTTHFGKTDQLPPKTFRGHQFTSSRDYFNGCTVKVARARARESRTRAQVTCRAEAAGIDGHDLALVVEVELRERAKAIWVLTNERGVRLSDALVREHSTALRVWHSLRTAPAPAPLDRCGVKYSARARVVTKLRASRSAPVGSAVVAMAPTSLQAPLGVDHSPRAWRACGPRGDDEAPTPSSAASRSRIAP